MALLLLATPLTAGKPASRWKPGDGRVRQQASALEEHYDSWQPGMPEVGKWRHYFDIYETHLARFRGSSVHMAELGLAHGGSLKLWRWYFGNRAHITGLDIANATMTFQGREQYGRPDKILIGNERFTSFWDRVRVELPRLDVFVDDGGHKYHHQIIVLEAMLKHLAPGGVYIVEDIIDQRFVKHVVDKYVLGTTSLNSFHWWANLVQRNLTQAQRSLFSVNFYPYAMVIEKLTEPRTVFRPDKIGSGNVKLEGHGGATFG